MTALFLRKPPFKKDKAPYVLLFSQASSSLGISEDEDAKVKCHTYGL